MRGTGWGMLPGGARVDETDDDGRHNYDADDWARHLSEKVPPRSAEEQMSGCPAP